MIYKHTQTGYLMIYVLFAVALLFGFILTQDGFNSVTLAIMFFTLFILASFTSLKVMIDENYQSIFI